MSSLVKIESTKNGSNTVQLLGMYKTIPMPSPQQAKPEAPINTVLVPVSFLSLFLSFLTLVLVQALVIPVPTPPTS